MAEGHCFSLSDAHIWHIPFIFYGWVKVVLLFLIGTSAFVSIDPITNNKEQKLLVKRLFSPINSDRACFHFWWEPHDDHLMQNSCCPRMAWQEYQQYQLQAWIGLHLPPPLPLPTSPSISPALSIRFLEYELLKF